MSLLQRIIRRSRGYLTPALEAAAPRVTAPAEQAMEQPDCDGSCPDCVQRDYEGAEARYHSRRWAEDQ